MKLYTRKAQGKKPKTWSRKGNCPSCHVGGGSRHREDCKLEYIAQKTI